METEKNGGQQELGEKNKKKWWTRKNKKKKRTQTEKGGRWGRVWKRMKEVERMEEVAEVEERNSARKKILTMPQSSR